MSPEFLTLDDLLAIAAAVLGRAPEIRDWGLIEAAVARPQASAFGEDAYPTMHAKAAALLHSLAGTQGLVDGNKRLGWVATRTFYELNGYRITATEDERYEIVMDVAEHRLDTVEDIAKRLALLAAPV